MEFGNVANWLDFQHFGSDIIKKFEFSLNRAIFFMLILEFFRNQQFVDKLEIIAENRI